MEIAGFSAINHNAQRPTSPMPPVPRDLLDELNRLFPPRPPRMFRKGLKSGEARPTLMREVWFDAGARSVVDLLQSHYDQQQESGNVL